MTTLAPTEWPLVLQCVADVELEGDSRPRLDTRSEIRPRGGSRRVVHKDPAYERCMARLTTSFLWAHRGGPKHRGWTYTRLDIVCARPQTRPLSVPQELWATGERVYRIGKPDGDNATKPVWDALVKAGVLHDDSHVVEWGGGRWYAAADEQPHVVVQVRGVRA